MASLRSKRRRSCESKIKHPDKNGAWMHAKKLGRGFCPYKCKFCSGWHVGRPGKQKRQSLAAQARNHH